jgi:hypothetical protein
MAAAKDILLQILLEAQGKELSLGKTQLIKLLYLVEVEHYRETGERLTDLDWIFYLYGPYAYELEEILADRIFEREDLKTGSERDFIRFRIGEPRRAYQSFLDTKLSLTVKRVVGDWGNRRLSELLDYIYFQTEPMQRVKARGERLDFESISRTSQEPVYPISASKDARKRVEDLRQRFRGFIKTSNETRELYLHRGKDELEAIEEWDAQDEKVDVTNITVKLSSKSSNASTTSSQRT